MTRTPLAGAARRAAAARPAAAASAAGSGAAVSGGRLSRGPVAPRLRSVEYARVTIGSSSRP